MYRGAQKFPERLLVEIVRRLIHSLSPEGGPDKSTMGNVVAVSGVQNAILNLTNLELIPGV